MDGRVRLHEGLDVAQHLVADRVPSARRRSRRRAAPERAAGIGLRVFPRALAMAAATGEEVVVRRYENMDTAVPSTVRNDL
jgi:hypothetical protein